MTDDVRSWGCKWLVMVEHITSCTTRSGGHCPAAVHPLNHLPLPGLTICGNDVGGCQPARFSGRTRVPIGTSNRLSVSTSARKSRSLKPGNICRERDLGEWEEQKKGDRCSRHWNDVAVQSREKVAGWPEDLKVAADLLRPLPTARRRAHGRPCKDLHAQHRSPGGGWLRLLLLQPLTSRSQHKVLSFLWFRCSGGNWCRCTQKLNKPTGLWIKGHRESL